MRAAKGALLQKLGDHLLRVRPVIPQLAAAEAVLVIGKQRVQRGHAVGAGQVGGDVVRVGDAHVGGGARGNVGDDVVVDFAVVGVQPQIHVDVGVQRLKILDGLLIDRHLIFVGVVFRPEGDFIVPGVVKGLRHREGDLLPGTVAAAQHKAPGQQQRKQAFHPLVPPLATPAMIFLRNSRNSTMSGTEMTTTAAIMAGMFSRPKPFSRIS